MIEDLWAFDDEFPTDILHRNEELNSLSRLLKPSTRGGRAEDVLIHGPSGVGKTATARWMLRDLRKRASVCSALLECSGKTGNRIIHEAVEKYPTGTVVQRNQPRSELVQTLEKIVDEPYIIVLDEADVIPDLDVLEDLLSVDLVSVIAITHSDDEWLNRVDRDLRPRFRGDSQIDYRRYHIPELVDILEPRIERGLVGQPVSADQLEWIADETGGVARWAIKSVLAAAELAGERGHESIHESDVADSFERAKGKIREANLRSLPVPYLRLYELVREIGPVDGVGMKRAYLEHQEAIFGDSDRGPVGWRRAWDYLSKMADYDLIGMPGETNSKVYEAVDPELEAPVKFDLREPAELD